MIWMNLIFSKIIARKVQLKIIILRIKVTLTLKEITRGQETIIQLNIQITLILNLLSKIVMKMYLEAATMLIDKV